MIRRTHVSAVLAMLLGGWLFLCGCSAPGEGAETAPATPLAAHSTSPALAAQPVPTEAPLPGTPASADLAIEIPESVELIPGESVVYTLTVRNNGPDPASGIVLTDVLPGEVMALWAQPAGEACRQVESGVECDLGGFTAGDAATVTLDLSGSGVEPVLTGVRGGSAQQDLPWLTCAADGQSTPPRVTCHLRSLQPRAEMQVRVGLDAAGQITGPLVHTAAVTANEDDPVPANNHAASTVVPGVARAPEAGAPAAVPDLVIEGQGPASVTTGQPFTYTYTVTNRGGLDATGVWFLDEIPADTNLLGYAPQPPRCEQQGDRLTCYLHDPTKGEAITFTLEVARHGGQPLTLELDPLLPGWPACFVIKEQTWQHFVICEIGVLKPGQATRVEISMVAIGSRPRTTSNTASVKLTEQDPSPLDNTSTMTITVDAGGEE